MAQGYEFDDEKFSFRKVSHPVWSIVRKTVRFLLVSVSMAVFYYLIISFVFSTETERRLRRENKLYEKLYPEMVAKSEILGDVVEDLGLRDNSIYSDIFSTAAPSIDPSGNVELSYYAVDSIEGRHIVRETSRKIVSVAEAGRGVDSNLLEFFDGIARGGSALPPMGMPVANFSYAKTGASVGQKLNPFYKVMSSHTGLDIMAAQGEDVLAAGDGTVTEARRSAKGQGNVVSIDHGNGYVTRYAHLGDIFVRRGQSVRTGARIATVGVTGSTFAPHLHYEVIKDSTYMDPVNYLFGALSPEEYANVVYMASSTRQSMD